MHNWDSADLERRPMPMPKAKQGKKIWTGKGIIFKLSREKSGNPFYVLHVRYEWQPIKRRAECEWGERQTNYWLILQVFAGNYLELSSTLHCDKWQGMNKWVQLVHCVNHQSIPSWEPKCPEFANKVINQHERNFCTIYES